MFYNVTQAAALSASHYKGSGDKLKIDEVATNSMKEQLDLCKEYNYHVVMGEGKKDKAPGLFAGEKYGNKKGKHAEIICDPVDGTTQTSKNGINALSCMAVGFNPFSFWTTEDYYLKKLLIGPSLRDWNGHIDDIKALVYAFKKRNDRFPSVILLNRPRNQEFIDQFNSLGADVQLLDDCDVSACLAVAIPQISSQKIHNVPDIYYGIGGATETIMIAPVARCFDLVFQAKGWGESSRLAETVLYKTDMADKDTIFVATGVLDGYCLDGCTIYYSNSLLISSNGTCDKISTYRNFKIAGT